MSAACRSFIRSDEVQFLLRSRMILALPITAYATGWLALGPRHRCAAPRRGRAASDRAEHARRRRSVIARAAALAALTVIVAAVGAGFGDAALALMAAAA